MWGLVKGVSAAMASQEDEGMSPFQVSLLRRLNNMKEKVPAPEEKAPPKGPASRNKAVHSFVNELQVTRNAVVQRGRTGGHGSPDSSSTATGKDSANTSKGNVGNMSKKWGGTLERKGSGQTSAVPPPAPKRNLGRPKMSPKPGAGSNGGVATADAADESTTQNKVAEIASKLGLSAQAGPQKEVSQAHHVKPKPKPAKAEKPVVVTEKPVAGGTCVPETPADQGVVATVPTAEEPVYVNVQQLLDTASHAHAPIVGGDKTEASQSESHQNGASKDKGQPPPHPHGLKTDGTTKGPQHAKKKPQGSKPHPRDATPPPAPRRTKSIRTTRNVDMNSAGSAGVNSGSNSGTSGDGVVAHHRRVRAPKVSNGGSIVPMGSSSESDYSGDGKVQRSAM